jgi:hypothetical protein
MVFDSTSLQDERLVLNCCEKSIRGCYVYIKVWTFALRELSYLKLREQLAHEVKLCR